MVWNTPSGVRKLQGAERTIYVNCVLDLINTVFSVITPENVLKKPTFAHKSHGSFYNLKCNDALLVLRSVCEALLTDIPAPELTSLYEAAAFCAIKHRSHTFYASIENCTALVELARQIPEGLCKRFLSDKKFDDDEDDDEDDDTESMISTSELVSYMQTMTGEMRSDYSSMDGVECFFEDVFASNILWDFDFEEEEKFASASQEKRFRMMVTVASDYVMQSAQCVNDLRKAYEMSMLSENEKHVALIDSIRSLCESI